MSGGSQHWRRRAEELRTLADHLHDQKASLAMRRLAQDYERRAEAPTSQKKLHGSVTYDRNRPPD
jgi:hypothetical protein